MGDFSHLRSTGEAAMVDISAKDSSQRLATVHGSVRVSKSCVDSLDDGSTKEIIATARIAGIQGAKHTAALVPMCHPIALTAVDIDIGFDRSSQTFHIAAITRTHGRTGVEMEALCAATIAGITVYDMIKAVDPAAVVGPFALVEKQGGKHGHWRLDP